MNTIVWAAAVCLFYLASAPGQTKVLTNDPLTGLPLIPDSVLVKGLGNRPVKMPNGQVCKSRMQGNFYPLYNYSSQQNIKFSEVIAWYASHLSGFKMIQSQEGKSPQRAFYNSDGTTVIFVTAKSSRQDENTKTQGIAYERYQPGLSEKTITNLMQGKIVCP
ncbi:MAG TPA: hypothetical protein VKV39_05590 [Candidatus Sulfotelmatobacter sp.]|nr:hypothetical protein [Candidatus Sulfotelmatobacter sp.]